MTAKTSKMREALKDGIKYKLNEEVKKEFDDVKAEILDSGFLQPYDPTRKIYVQTDASKLGLGYILYQIEGDTRKRGEKIMGSDPAKTRKEKEEETEKQKPNEPKKQKRSKEVEKKEHNPDVQHRSQAQSKELEHS